MKSRNPGPTRTATDVELAWAAGFFDGEGYLGLPAQGPTRRSYAPQMVVGQKDRRPLDLLQAIFGGRIGIDGIGRKEAIWVWEQGSHDAIRRVLRAMLPYLTTKREQAECMLAYIAHRGRPDSSRAFTEWERAESASFSEALRDLKQPVEVPPWTR